jgi:uncharacterized membrane protein
MNSLLLLAISQRLQNSALILGLFGMAVGVMLMKGHQTVFQRSLRHSETPAARNFEARKLRRRTIVAALVTSVGCMLTAIYWVTEIRVLAIFTLLIICQLLFMLGIALVDFLLVSMRLVTKPESQGQKAIIEDILRSRREAAEQQQKSETQEKQ